MNRKMALQIVLGIVGVLFVAAIYPLAMMVRQNPALAMMMSLYFTLGIFLLLAIRDPWGSRKLIAFTAWSSFAHGALMAYQAWRGMIQHRELIGVAVMFLIGALLLALAPARQPVRNAVGV